MTTSGRPPKVRARLLPAWICADPGRTARATWAAATRADWSGQWVRPCRRAPTVVNLMGVGRRRRARTVLSVSRARVSVSIMHPRAGQRARPEDLVDLDALVHAYGERHPDPADVA